MAEFSKTSRFNVPPRQLFDWHCRPGAFERLSPPWGPPRVEEVQGTIPEDGSILCMSIPAGPVRMQWTAEHRNFQPGVSFQDVQTSGPFAEWCHTHLVEPAADDPQQSTLTDRIQYRVGYLGLGDLIGGLAVGPMLRTMFEYRHRITAEDLRQHQELSNSPRTILITGATGMVGSPLTAFLSTGGHEVRRLVRGAPGPNDVLWDPAGGTIDREALEGVDAVVHLAGENIAGGRWSAARKNAILNSRVNGTRLLAEALAGMQQKPEVLISASAIGFYGDRGQEPVDESAEPGGMFLSEVCKRWEEAARPAGEAGIRVVNLRTGVVLGAAGGALASMLPPFRLGLGGVLGSGKQAVSWIGLDDMLGIILHCIQHGELHGPVNAVVPEPTDNRGLTKTLGKVLRRPTIAAVPGFAARALLGEMADELLLRGAAVVPGRLQETGYRYRSTDLGDVLRNTLGLAK